MQSMLSDKAICFTGKMQTPRAELAKMANQAGATVKSSMTNDVNILVIADPHSQSLKAQNARRNGVSLISENQFLEMINEA